MPTTGVVSDSITSAPDAGFLENVAVEQPVEENSLRSRSIPTCRTGRIYIFTRPK